MALRTDPSERKAPPPGEMQRRHRCGVAFELKVADGVEDGPVGRRVRGQLSPLGNGRLVLPFGREELRVLKHCAAVDSQEDSSPDVESTLTVN